MRLRPGADFAAESSRSDGEIIFAGVNGPYGNQVAVEHEDGTVTTYSHLNVPATRSSTVGSTGENVTE